jgi:hypothetical protein
MTMLEKIDAAIWKRIEGMGCTEDAGLARIAVEAMRNSLDASRPSPAKIACDLGLDGAVLWFKGYNASIAMIDAILNETGDKS